ncbi:hypothetical protein [Acholeplasma laidlawii]|uniref:hypothetical protein n=1 Tax=Acholeplasma laidlawii TaxID=2148 RepID=UPI0021F6CD9C|nr:hypothetical protein [Acholeplasma laidlawii]
MKLLLKLILNRFMLSILIIFFFALDYKFVRLNPVELYTVKRPPETTLADSYYVIEFGETDIFIEITYLDGKIHLVPKSELSNPLTEENKPLIAWYYYVLGLALANTIPFGWFTKSKKVSKKHKK